jgi:hypothetical protein
MYFLCLMSIVNKHLCVIKNALFLGVLRAILSSKLYVKLRGLYTLLAYKRSANTAIYVESRSGNAVEF